MRTLRRRAWLVAAFVLLFVAVPSATWFRAKLQWARHQHDARQELYERSHGIVAYRMGFEPYVRFDEPRKGTLKKWPVPYFLVEWLGEDFFSDGIYWVDLWGPNVPPPGR